MNLKLFLKSTRPSLPLKKAPPLFPSPFPLRGQGMYQPPYSVLKPLRYMDGGPSEVYASCGFLCGDEPAFTQGFAKGLLARCFFRKPTSPPLNLKSLSKTHQSSLTLKGGSTSHLGLLPSGKKRKPLLSIVFTTPSVPLVGDRNGAQTATLYGWRTIRGLRQQRSCGFLCGMNRNHLVLR